MAQVTKTRTYSSGGQLTASNYNADRDEIIAGVNTVDTAQLAASAVTTAKIADSNVTTAKIADSNVTTAKIADSNVTTAKIADSNVTTAKIADSNVTTAKIADSNVTTAKIADDAVTAAKLYDLPKFWQDNFTTAKQVWSGYTSISTAFSFTPTYNGMIYVTASGWFGFDFAAVTGNFRLRDGGTSTTIGQAVSSLNCPASERAAFSLNGQLTISGGTAYSIALETDSGTDDYYVSGTINMIYLPGATAEAST